MIIMVQFLCPPNYATGGTEAVFACVDMLAELGIPAQLVLTDLSDGQVVIWGESGVPERFRKYRYNLANEISSAATAIVCPEYYLKNLRVLSDYPVWIWWLSVDNAFESIRFRKRLDLVVKTYITNYRLKRAALDIAERHTCQSAYARTKLESWGIQSSMLSDYVVGPGNSDVKEKQHNLVCYNARRGESKAVEVLAHLSESVDLVPIKNMTLDQVHLHLSRSILCLDFGYFPGKDRLVRESALFGNVVVTGTDGSAKFFEDFPLDKAYKFGSGRSHEVLRCKDLVRDILDDPNAHVRAQSRFRKCVLLEREIFMSEVLSLFS